MSAAKARAQRFFIASGCPIATTTLYRCRHLQEQLRLLGHDAEVAEWFAEAKIDAALVDGFEAIVLYRLAMCPELERVIAAARAAGKPVIFDTDDLIFEPELLHWHRAVQKLTAADRQQHARGVGQYLDTLLACDAVTVATPLLADLAQPHGKRVFVHRNALGSEMLALADQSCDRRTNTRVVIGYGSGTDTHDVDFREAERALAHVLAKFSNTELWIAGPLQLPEELQSFANRIRRFPLTDWRGWFDLQSQFDIAIAPLELGNVFCRAKSEIKFIEAAAVRVPIVASKIDSYEQAISNESDGFLAAGDVDWVCYLSRLIENRAERICVGERARATALARYTPHARAKDLAQILPGLLMGAAATGRNRERHH